MQALNAAFGERLREAREGAGLTQDELAEKMGVTQKQVSKWERGVVPMARRFDLLAASVGATPEWLLFGKGKPPKPPKGVHARPKGYKQITRKRGEEGEEGEA